MTVLALILALAATELPKNCKVEYIEKDKLLVVTNEKNEKSSVTIWEPNREVEIKPFTWVDVSSEAYFHRNLGIQWDASGKVTSFHYEDVYQDHGRVVNFEAKCP